MFEALCALFLRGTEPPCSCESLPFESEVSLRPSISLGARPTGRFLFPVCIPAWLSSLTRLYMSYLPVSCVFQSGTCYPFVCLSLLFVSFRSEYLPVVSVFYNFAPRLFESVFVLFLVAVLKPPPCHSCRIRLVEGFPDSLSYFPVSFSVFILIIFHWKFVSLENITTFAENLQDEML